MLENRDQELTRLRTELAQAQAALADAELRATEREQARLAQVLHDGVCQSMTALRLMARVIARKLQASCPESAQDMNELGDLIQRAAREVQDVAYHLPARNGKSSDATPKP